MAPYCGNLSWSEVRDQFRIWRESNERKSREIVEMWCLTLMFYTDKLSEDEHLLVLEQVYVAALDCNRKELALFIMKSLTQILQTPYSSRLKKLQIMYTQLELERCDEELMRPIADKEKTNAAIRKQKIALAKNKSPSLAIKELTEYLNCFMNDQEAWIELSNLYIKVCEFSKAGFCIEELIMQSPHNHLLYQRYAEIKYTQGGYENMEIAKTYYCYAAKLNPKNVRALYGIYLSTSNLSQSSKTPAPKKKELLKLASWALQKVQDRYKTENAEKNQLDAVDSLMGQLQIS